MATPMKLGGFAAVLAAAFAGAVVAGDALGPEPAADKSRPHSDSGGHGSRPGDATTTSSDGHAQAPRGTATNAAGVRGLAIAENGLRMVVERPELRRGRSETLRYAVVDDRGEVVRDFDVEHEERMHLIVARRDMTGFQHLHPRQARDGYWQTTVRLGSAGSYRVFADFVHEDEASTLGTDLRVDGRANLRDLPAPAPRAVSDGGYDVRLTSDGARPRKPAELRFDISRGGETVHVEPYLGAGGHLVALREGDLAFLHVHPSDHGDSKDRGHDDSIGFEATFPTEGRYRLFLQFKHERRVHTAAFTQQVR